MKEYHYNQSLADKLTILLPLKGRPLFTLRYFLYMEEVQCPFKIFIADGSLNEENKNIIDENKHRFPHVNFEYHRFPPDNTILDFTKKMAGALNLIRTPYVVENSNDDFYVIDTIIKSIEFLEQDVKKEYVACGGAKYTFETKDGLAFNPIRHITPILYNNYYREGAVTNNVALNRVLLQMPFKYPFIQYDVLRTLCLRNAYDLLWKNKICNLIVSEYFTVRYLISLGKRHLVNAEYLYSQLFVSVWKQRFFLELVLEDNFSENHNQCMRLLAEKICGDDANRIGAVEQQLKEKWVQSINPKTFIDFLRFQNVMATDFMLQFRNFVRKLLKFKQFIKIPLRSCKTLKVIKDLMHRYSSFNENVKN